MEGTPFHLGSPEDDDSDNDEDDRAPKKKRRSLESLLGNDQDKKEKVGLDIAKSLFERQEEDKELKEKPEAHKPEEHPDATVEEKSPVDLSPEDEVYVNQTIAADHLEHPVTDGEPEQPVTDFLERVVDGSSPDEAYDDTLEDNNFTDETNPVYIPRDEQAASETIVVNNPGTTLNVSNENQATTARTSPPAAQAWVPGRNTYRRREAKADLSSELSAYLIGRRSGKKETKAKLAPQQKRLENQVRMMEDSLSNQELSIQRLSKENKVKLRQIEPLERTTQSKVESRLNLTKPERLEQIGKVVIAAERPKTAKESVGERVIRPNNLRQYFRPEEVKTMRRQDLIIVSEKIIVEGASLKDMYENNLFSERALRRLVADYLKGNDIREPLRREIVERERDFERDPQLRDRLGLEQSAELSSLFDNMLAHAELPGSKSPAKQTSRPKGPTPHPEDTKQLINHSPTSNIALALLIAILITVIVYLLLHKF